MSQPGPSARAAGRGGRGPWAAGPAALGRPALDFNTLRQSGTEGHARRAPQGPRRSPLQRVILSAWHMQNVLPVVLLRRSASTAFPLDVSTLPA